MKKSHLILLLCLALLTPFAGHAQFEDDEGNGAADMNEELDPELVEEKASGASAKSEDEPAEPAAAGEVTKEELQKLSDAKKTKTESAIVKAAAEILGKDPNHAQALNSLGVLYFEVKKYGMAKIVLKRALKAHPNNPALHNNLGIVYLAEGDMRLALESFKKSTQVETGYRIGATNLSAIYVQHRDYKNSLAPLEETYSAVRSDLRRGDESAVEIGNNYAVALMGVGEQSKARKVFEEIYGSSSRNPGPFLNYAILLVEVLKEKKDAIRVISKLKFMTEDREILRRVQDLENKLE